MKYLTRAALYRVMMLSRAYVLHSMLAKTNRYEIDPPFPLYKQCPETPTHYICNCLEMAPAMENVLEKITTLTMESFHAPAPKAAKRAAGPF